MKMAEQEISFLMNTRGLEITFSRSIFTFHAMGIMHAIINKTRYRKISSQIAMTRLWATSALYWFKYSKSQNYCRQFFYGKVRTFKYLGLVLTDQNHTQEKIKHQLKEGNSYYYSVQTLVFCHLDFCLKGPSDDQYVLSIKYCQCCK